jgi:LuxR family transcriptional regulator, quorum-sensing system regulator BjaR1
MSEKKGRNGPTSKPVKPPRITPREADVLRPTAEGLTDPEIAERLCVSRSTVNTHLVHLREKLKVRNRVTLVREAQRLGLIPTEA